MPNTDSTKTNNSAKNITGNHWRQGTIVSYLRSPQKELKMDYHPVIPKLVPKLIILRWCKKNITIQFLLKQCGESSVLSPYLLHKTKTKPRKTNTDMYKISNKKMTSKIKMYTRGRVVNFLCLKCFDPVTVSDMSLASCIIWSCHITFIARFLLMEDTFKRVIMKYFRQLCNTYSIYKTTWESSSEL